MNDDSDLKGLEQHTFRVANQDGLTEILTGLMIIGIALILIESIFVVFVALLIVFQAVAVEGVKEKYTYPRIGRVKLKKEYETNYGRYWGVSTFIMFVAFASVLVSVWIQNELIEFLARCAPLLLGIGLLQPLALLVERSGLGRYYGVGVTAVILGAALVLLEIASVDRMILYLLAVGGLLFLAGLTRLVRFIRKYPVLDLEDADHEQEQ